MQLEAIRRLEVALLFLDAFTLGRRNLLFELAPEDLAVEVLALHDVLDVGDLARLVAHDLLLDDLQVAEADGLDFNLSCETEEFGGRTSSAAMKK